MRTFHIWGNKNCNKQQTHKARIYQEGEDIIEAIIKHKDDKADCKRANYPNEFFTGTSREIEEVGLIEVETGTTHTEPPRNKQSDDDDECPPIQFFPNTNAPG